MDIHAAIQDFLDGLSLSPHTIRAYKNGMNCFTGYLAVKKIKLDDDISKITINILTHFWPYLSNNYSKRSAMVYGAAVVRFTKYLTNNEIIDPTYREGIRLQDAVIDSRKRREEKMQKHPAKDAVSKMLIAVRLMHNNPNLDEPPRHERNIALFELLASSGCRVSEITALNVKDVNFSEKTMVVTGKGRKERQVWFSQPAADALKAYWLARGTSEPDDPVFCRHDKGAGKKHNLRMTQTTVRDIIKDVLIYADVDQEFHTHSFRHAFATRVLRETGNLKLVQTLLGHKDIATTGNVYTDIDPDDIRDAHREIFK